MRILICFLSMLVLVSITNAQTPNSVVRCTSHLERARVYEIYNDNRAEGEWRAALRDGDKRCVDGLVELTHHLTRNLRFAEAADTLEDYVMKTPQEDHREDRKELTTLRNAAEIQKRLAAAEIPDLNDLIAFTKLANGYGRLKADDALPYAEKAVNLYPGSVDSLMLLADLLIPLRKDNDRVELLLNQAVTIDANNARVRSTRGWFLFSRGRSADAEKEFQKALELDDKDRTAWKGTGYILMSNGKKKEALNAFEKYLSLRKPGESNTEIATLVEQLKEGSVP